jgi:hypothetical protein
VTSVTVAWAASDSVCLREGGDGARCERDGGSCLRVERWHRENPVQGKANDPQQTAPCDV